LEVGKLCGGLGCRLEQLILSNWAVLGEHIAFLVKTGDFELVNPS
jgi:hypothetical protein